jgi:hypothetical protein
MKARIILSKLRFLISPVFPNQGESIVVATKVKQNEPLVDTTFIVQLRRCRIKLVASEFGFAPPFRRLGDVDQALIDIALQSAYRAPPEVRGVARYGVVVCLFCGL